MKQAVEKLLTLIFGIRRSSGLLSHVSLQKEPHDTHPYISAIFSYKDNSVRAMVWNLKYKNCRETARVCGRHLYEVIIADIHENLREHMPHVILPIPATRHRLQKHGWNPCERLVKAIIANDRAGLLEYNPHVLCIHKEQESKARNHRTKKERSLLVQGMFGIKNTKSILHKRVILIDDVWTTGATLTEARAVLLKAGARDVICYTLAH